MTYEFGVNKLGKTGSERPKCEYPGCTKNAFIPIPTKERGKYFCVCYECLLKVQEEEKKKKIREEIIKMKEEGTL